MGAKKLKRLLDPHVEYTEFIEFLDGINNAVEEPTEVLAFLACLGAMPLQRRQFEYFVRYIEERHANIVLKHSKPIVNIVGTGGGVSTFNVSTTAAIVAASAGASILKSGSFAYSSKSGSLDILRQIGAPLCDQVSSIDESLQRSGIAFLSPKLYDPFLTRLAMAILPFELKKIGSFVNKAGPLLCPFQVHSQVTGVASAHDMNVLSEVFHALGRENILLVRSQMRLDEFCSVGENYYEYIVSSNNSKHGNYSMKRTGVDKHEALKKLKGGGPEENAQILKGVLDNSIVGEKRIITVMNAAACLWVGGYAESMEHGIDLCEAAISEGCAEFTLDQIGHSNSG